MKTCFILLLACCMACMATAQQIKQLVQVEEIVFRYPQPIDTSGYRLMNVRFYIPEGYKKEKGFEHCYGHYMHYAYKQAHFSILRAHPAFTGSSYNDDMVITAETEHGGRGTIKNTSFYWREEFVGRTYLSYMNANQEQKTIFDQAMDEIIKQIKQP